MSVVYFSVHPISPQDMREPPPPSSVAGLSPAAAHVGSNVHLQGTNLTGVGGAPPEVTLGGVACAVTASGSEWVNCTAGDAPLGVGLEVVVTVPGVGLARTSSGVSFTQQAAVTDLTLTLTLTLTLFLTLTKARSPPRARAAARRHRGRHTRC